MFLEPKSDLSVCVSPDLGVECSDDEALDDVQDEEVSRWVQEQIRKGISIPQVKYSAAERLFLWYFLNVE